MISTKLALNGVLRSISQASLANFTRKISTSSISSNNYSKFVPTTPEQEQFLARDTEKGLFTRKTYLIDNYKHLYDSNEILLFVHYNNLSKLDNAKYRQELLAAGANLHVIKGSIFKLLLRSISEADPALKGLAAKNIEVQNPLAPLIAGPTAIISIPKSDPSIVTAVMKILKTANEKLLLLGAKIESEVMNLDQINEFKTLPTKETLQGQLVGLLTMAGGAGLVRTLGTPGSALYLNLEQRKKDMEDPSEEKNE